MKIALSVLRRFVDLPEPFPEVRRWMDRVGLEVKRATPDAPHGGGFTLELLANRGDHHCYDGLARELAGRLARPVCGPEVASLGVGDSPHPIALQTELVLRYSLTALVRVPSAPVAPLAAEALAVLEASELSPVSPPVDATNVANLELGQPTHAFDADTIVGPVTLRTSRAGERAWPLFQPAPVELPAGTLVVADDAKILAIAGVIGCEESKTTDATTRILLESATFDPVAVRKAARALGLSTDASARFERGADPERVLVGAGRVVTLLEATGAWQRAGTSGLAGSWVDPGRTLSFTLAQAERALGRRFEPAEVSERLERYGFRVRAVSSGEHGFHVVVPSHRLWDVEFPADLYEELAKSVGYENFVPALPAIEMGALPSPGEVARRTVDDVLVGLGFYEIFTDGFYGRQAREALGLTPGHPLWDHVETTNALDRAYSLLKNNTLHQALEAVATNERRKLRTVSLYEWTRTFHPLPASLPAVARRDAPPCTERKVLWLLTAGADRAKAWQDTSRPADATHLRGVLRELSVALGVDLEPGPLPDGGDDAPHGALDLLHPGRSGVIRSAGRCVGVYGEVHPAVVRNHRIKHAAPCWLELEVEALLAEPVRPAFTEPPANQPVTRALAFALPAGVEAGSVGAVLHAYGPDSLSHVRVVDWFDLGSGADGKPSAAVTFELEFEGEPRSADETNQLLRDLVAEVLREFGPQGVTQR
jgi:phenylalanyl-tRNA synthetase beta chain